MKRKTIVGIATIFAVAAFSVLALAQDAPRGREGPQGERVMGTITSVGVGQLTIKKMDGTPLTVMVNDQTRLSEGRRQDQKSIQLEDLKAGDGVFVLGHAGDNQQFNATIVHRVPAEMLQRFQANQGNRAFGEIESIDGNQLKVRNRRGEQTITVNDQTTFMKDGQSITLKDLKVGDRIFAVGQESGGQFVATRVMSGQFRGRGMRGNRPDRTGAPAQPQNP